MGHEKLKKEGAEQERARIIEIRESALDGQTALVEDLIKTGATADEARKAFIVDLKKRNIDDLKAIAKHTTGIRRYQKVLTTPADYYCLRLLFLLFPKTHKKHNITRHKTAFA